MTHFGTISTRSRRTDLLTIRICRGEVNGTACYAGDLCRSRWLPSDEDVLTPGPVGGISYVEDEGCAWMDPWLG